MSKIYEALERVESEKAGASRVPTRPPAPADKDKPDAARETQTSPTRVRAQPASRHGQHGQAQPAQPPQDSRSNAESPDPAQAAPDPSASTSQPVFARHGPRPDESEDRGVERQAPANNSEAQQRHANASPDHPAQRQHWQASAGHSPTGRAEAEPATGGRESVHALDPQSKRRRGLFRRGLAGAPVPRVDHRSQPSPSAPPHPVQAFRWESRFEDRMGELYRPIVTRLPEGRGLIAFVSPTRQAGVSMVAREFSQFLAAEAGHGTLLLDADTTRPSQFGHYNLVCNADINEVARGERSLSEAVQALGNTGLSIAALGQRSAGRTVLLNSPRTQGIMQDLRARFDILVADCPTPETSGGVAALCAEADVVVIVIQAGRTAARDAARLKERIEVGGGQPIAVVWNTRGLNLPRWLRRLT